MSGVNMGAVAFQVRFGLKQGCYRCDSWCIAYEGGLIFHKWDKGNGKAW